MLQPCHGINRCLVGPAVPLPSAWCYAALLCSHTLQHAKKGSLPCLACSSAPMRRLCLLAGHAALRGGRVGPGGADLGRVRVRGAPRGPRCSEEGRQRQSAVRGRPAAACRRPARLAAGRERAQQLARSPNPATVHAGHALGIRRRRRGQQR